MLRSVLAAAALCSNVMLRNVLAAAALCSAHNATMRCPPIRPLSPIRERVDLGGLLRHRNLTGDGVEVGVQQGLFTGTLLRGWRRCGAFVQVDPWRPLGTTGDRAQAAGAAEHAANREFAGAVLDAAVDLGYARSGEQCADTSDACAALYGDGRFDFVYVDAGHDRRSVLGDLARWWPKLRAGGVMAGHDYTEQREPSPHEWADPPPEPRPEPFDARQRLVVRVAGADRVLETRHGEARADAARRFVAAWPLDLAGAGCGFDDGACVAAALADAPGWVVEAMPVNEWKSGGYDDPCLPCGGECDVVFDPASSDQDWTSGGDVRAVKGAVDDFFSGAAPEAPAELRDCPRQVVVTYRDRGWNTWMVAK